MNFNDAGRFIPRSNLFPSMSNVGNGQGMGNDPRSALINQQSAGHYGISQAPPMQDDLQMLRGMPQYAMPQTQPNQVIPPDVHLPEMTVGGPMDQSALLQHIKSLLQTGGGQEQFHPAIGRIHQIETVRRLAAMLAQQYHGTRRQFAGLSGGRLVQ